MEALFGMITAFFIFFNGLDLGQRKYFCSGYVGLNNQGCSQTRL